MAGDWIKMRSAIAADPDVVQIAAALNLDEFGVVGRLHAVWSWLDQHSDDGTNVRIVSAFLDRLTACPGFADAMRAVGWLAGRDGSIDFPGYTEHNGETAKTRALAQKRKAKERDKCHGGGVTREEERRGEKSTNPKSRPPREQPPKAALGDTDEQWIAELSAKDCYRSVNVKAELGKAQTWAATNHRQCTRRFFVNWLNRALADSRVVSGNGKSGKALEWAPAKPAPTQSPEEYERIRLAGLEQIAAAKAALRK